MEIRKQSLAGVPLLEIEDDIDHSWAEVFDQAIKESLQGRDRLVLDLTRCGYWTAAGSLWYSPPRNVCARAGGSE